MTKTKRLLNSTDGQQVEPVPYGYGPGQPLEATPYEDTQAVRRGPEDEAVDMRAGRGWTLPAETARRAGLISDR